MTTTSSSTIILIARLLLGFLFLIAGLGKLGDVQGFAGYMASGGVPAFLAWPVILLEILGGFALIIGWQARLAALALAVFCLSSGVLYHFVPGDQMQMTSFFKNLALAGGYLLLFVQGAGAYSVDARLSPARPATA